MAILTVLRNIFLIFALCVSFSIYADAQKHPAKVAPNVDTIDRLVKNSGYEYTVYGKGVWTIQSGTNVVMIGGGADIMVAFMAIADKGKFQITAESMLEMLKLGSKLDHVKFIIDDQGDLAVRSDSRLRLMDKAGFDDVIVRVINGYEKATAKIAPYLIK